MIRFLLLNNAKPEALYERFSSDRHLDVRGNFYEMHVSQSEKAVKNFVKNRFDRDKSFFVQVI